jgi:hypothetical protein
MQYVHQHKTQNHPILSAGLLYHLLLSTNYYLKQKSRRNLAKFVHHISYPKKTMFPILILAWAVRTLSRPEEKH